MMRPFHVCLSELLWKRDGRAPMPAHGGHQPQTLGGRVSPGHFTKRSAPLHAASHGPQFRFGRFGPRFVDPFHPMWRMRDGPRRQQPRLRFPRLKPPPQGPPAPVLGPIDQAGAQRIVFDL